MKKHFTEPHLIMIQVSMASMILIAKAEFFFLNIVNIEHNVNISEEFYSGLECYTW